MSVKILTEHHLEFLSLKGGCTGSSEGTLVKIPHCWKSHVAAHIICFCRKDGDRSWSKPGHEVKQEEERIMDLYSQI